MERRPYQEGRNLLRPLPRRLEGGFPSYAVAQERDPPAWGAAILAAPHVHGFSLSAVCKIDTAKRLHHAQLVPVERVCARDRRIDELELETEIATRQPQRGARDFQHHLATRNLHLPKSVHRLAVHENAHEVALAVAAFDRLGRLDPEGDVYRIVRDTARGDGRLPWPWRDGAVMWFA